MIHLQTQLEYLRQYVRLLLSIVCMKWILNVFQMATGMRKKSQFSPTLELTWCFVHLSTKVKVILDLETLSTQTLFSLLSSFNCRYTNNCIRFTPTKASHVMPEPSSCVAFILHINAWKISTNSQYTLRLVRVEKNIAYFVV